MDKVGPLFQQFTWPSSQQEDPCWLLRGWAGSEHSSTLGSEGTHELTLGTATIFKQQGQELVSPPPVQPGPPSIWKMGLQQRVWRVPRMRPPQTQESSRENVDNSNLDTASGAQTQTRCPKEMLAKSIGRGYGLPVDWAKAVSGWRVSWKESMTGTSGHMTMKALELSGNALLWKTTTPLRCKKWWCRSANCFALLRLLIPKFTLESSKAKTHGKAKTLVLFAKTISHPLLLVSMKKEQLGPW